MGNQTPFPRHSETNVWVIVLFSSFFAFSCSNNNRDLKKQLKDEGNRFQQEQYIVRNDTIIVPIMDKHIVVHSLGYNQSNQIIEVVTDLFGTGRNISNTGSNLSILAFSIPDSVTAWSYYIGVNQAGLQAYANATSQLMNAVTSYNSDPVVALALGSFSYLTTTQSGENVQYWIVDGKNRDLLLQKQEFESIARGDVINDFARITFPLSGNYFICMANDNPVSAIEVMIKISAIKIHNYYGTRRIKVRNSR